MMKREGTSILAGEDDIKKNRKNYKVGMYFTVSIILTIVIWSMLSEARWMIFDSGVGERYHYDIWMVIGVIVTVLFTALSFFTLGQVASGMVKECDVLGGAIHMEERQIVFWWAVIIGMVLGMGFWDIITEINLAFQYGIINIWLIPVTVFDFGVFQMVIPVWELMIIGVAKMGAVIVLYIVAARNIHRGTVCELAGLDKGAILS